MTAAPPTSLGTVLAHLVDPGGRTVKGGTLRGQLHASPDGLWLLRPTTFQLVLSRSALTAMALSFTLVAANLLVWRRMEPLWAALALQGLYMVTLPMRRKALEPRPTTAEALAAAAAAGTVALRVPAKDLGELAPPGAGQAGRRTPARLGLPAGALELWLTPADYEALRTALGRGEQRGQPERP
jgi:hypothetical protein